MRPGDDGLPDPSRVEFFHESTGGIVDLVVGPGGDLFYPNIDDGQIHRIRYYPSNTPPVAEFTVSPDNGPAPLEVELDGSASRDPEGGPLSYEWDLDGDGEFDDATGSTATVTLDEGTYELGLRVTDDGGAVQTATRSVSSGNSRPVPVIDSPTIERTWRAGEDLSFSGSATDPDEGVLGGESLSWRVRLLTCDEDGTGCITRVSLPFAGSSGSLSAPDWAGQGYSVLEFELTATDSRGLTGTTAVRILPETVVLTFETDPPGLELAVGADSKTTPFTRTVIVGSQQSLGAPSPQALGGAYYEFDSWSDGGARTHVVNAPDADSTISATYTQTVVPNLVLAMGFEEVDGAAASDSSVFGNDGLVAGAGRTDDGRFGRALSFDGLNDQVRIDDDDSLDLTDAMTLSAWVKPDVVTDWRTVLLKEDPAIGDLAYSLYAAQPAGGPSAYVRAGTLAATVSPQQLPVDAWSHLAVVYDGTTLSVYQDAAVVASVPYPGGINTTSGVLSIGGNAVWGEWFSGLIDEVRVYDRALDASEVLADSLTPIASDDTAPTTPSGLTATGSLGTVQLEWTAATDDVGVTGYDIHRSATDGFTPDTSTLIAQSTTTSYTDNVTAGTWYYRVTATDAAGNTSEASDQAQGDSLPDAPPGAPSDLTATGSLGTVQLEWTAATDDVGVTGYDIHRSATDGFTPDTSTLIAQSTTTSYTDNVTAGTWYYRVTATDAAGNTSEASDQAQGDSLPDAPPGAPSDLTATGSLGTVQLEWTAATDDVGVTGYDIHRSATDGFTPDTSTLIAQSTTTSYTDNVTAGTWYYRVTATDTTGQVGPPSDQAQGDSLADTTDPDIQITSPTDGSTVSGTITITAEATDDDAITQVSFTIDGTPIGTPDTTAPFTTTWDTTTTTNDTHTLTATATDPTGNTNTDTITLTTDNTVVPNLVLAMGFEEVDGAAASDSSVFGNDGLVAGAGRTDDGRFGRALSFDGLNDQVRIDDDDSLDLTDAMTLSAWVKPDVVTDWRTVLLKEDPAIGDLAYSLYAAQPAGGPSAYVRAGTLAATVSPQQLPVDAWSHLAVVYDGTTLSVYQDAAVVASVPYPGGINTTSGVLSIGGNAVWGEWFSGLIDEVRVYDRCPRRLRGPGGQPDPDRIR